MAEWNLFFNVNFDSIFIPFFGFSLIVVITAWLWLQYKWISCKQIWSANRPNHKYSHARTIQSNTRDTTPNTETKPSERRDWAMVSVVRAVCWDWQPHDTISILSQQRNNVNWMFCVRRVFNWDARIHFTRPHSRTHARPPQPTTSAAHRKPETNTHSTRKR